MSEDDSRRVTYDIFVSYTAKDAARIGLLVAALEKAGWRVFWDQDIPAGEDWDSYIGLQLDSAPVVVAVWSTLSVKSRFVRDEVTRADERGALVPVTIDAVKPMFGFGQIHAANLIEWIANGGGTLPDSLKQAIARKISGRAGRAPGPAPERPSPADENRPVGSAPPQPQDPSLHPSAMAGQKARSVAKSAFSKGKVAALVGLFVLLGVGGDELLTRWRAPDQRTTGGAAIEASVQDFGPQKDLLLSHTLKNIANIKRDEPANAARNLVANPAETVEADLNLTEADRRDLQIALTALGFDTTVTDGNFGPQSREMIAAWQKARNYPATGFFTGAQTMALNFEYLKSLAGKLKK